MSTSDDSLKETGRCAAASLVEMVAALECDYDRLDALREGLGLYAVSDATTCPCGLYIHPDRANHEAIHIDDCPHAHRLDEVSELAELEAEAGECTTREEAETRIQEDALSVEVRTGWYVPSDCVDARNRPTAEEFMILLTTGGPAVRIMGELSNGEPERAWLEVQDWGTPWTRYYDIEQDTLLAYARCFYFGEG